MHFVMGRRKRSDHAAVCSHARKRIKLSNSGLRPRSAGVVRKEFQDVGRVILVGYKMSGRVLFLEAGDNFVEILGGLLAIPVASAVKLLSKEGVEGGLNGISNISNGLDKFTDPTLVPRKPEDILQLVPSNPSAAKDVVLYECCNRVSTRPSSRCPCSGSILKLSLFTLALAPKQELMKEVRLYDCGARPNGVSANSLLESCEGNHVILHYFEQCLEEKPRS